MVENLDVALCRCDSLVGFMRYRTEILPNGIMRVHDHECKWDLLYRKEKGKWVAHGLNSGLPGYRHLLRILNGR